MEMSPTPENTVLENAYNSIDNLSILLRFIDTCFKHVLAAKLGALRYELTFDYGDDHEYKSIVRICEVLKGSIKRQLDNSNEIDGSVYLNFYQKIAINSEEEELRYTGVLRIFNNACFIRFLWHSNSREIRIDISRHLLAEEVVNTYTHFQEAILYQLNRLSNEQ